MVGNPVDPIDNYDQVDDVEASFRAFPTHR